MSSALLDISDVTRRSGLTAATLRYYEDIGLIQSAGRHGLRRQYEHGVLDQLTFIRMAKLADVSLKELARLARPNGYHVDRDLLADKITGIDSQIERLTALRGILTHIQNCPEEDPFTCPRFQKLLRIAGRITGQS